LMQVEDVKETTAATLLQACMNVRPLIEELRKVIKLQESAKVEGPLSGKAFA